MPEEQKIIGFQDDAGPSEDDVDQAMAQYVRSFIAAVPDPAAGPDRAKRLDAIFARAEELGADPAVLEAPLAPLAPLASVPKVPVPV